MTGGSRTCGTGLRPAFAGRRPRGRRGLERGNAYRSGQAPDHGRAVTHRAYRLRCGSCAGSSPATAPGTIRTRGRFPRRSPGLRAAWLAISRHRVRTGCHELSTPMTIRRTQAGHARLRPAVLALLGSCYGSGSVPDRRMRSRDSRTSSAWRASGSRIRSASATEQREIPAQLQVDLPKVRNFKLKLTRQLLAGRNCSVVPWFRYPRLTDVRAWRASATPSTRRCPHLPGRSSPRRTTTGKGFPANSYAGPRWADDRTGPSTPCGVQWDGHRE